jgi:hypothetical protein
MGGIKRKRIKGDNNLWMLPLKTKSKLLRVTPLPKRIG